MYTAAVNVIPKRVSFGSKQAKYSLKTPVQFASVQELASVDYDAVITTGTKPKFISGAAKMKAHPERYKNILSHTEEGNRCFEQIYDCIGINRNSTLGDFKEALIKTYKTAADPVLVYLKRGLK